MELYQSLENFLLVQTKKLWDLENATKLIQGKTFIQEELLKAFTEVSFVIKDIHNIQEDIVVIKQNYERGKILSSELKFLNNQIQYMIKNIPSRITEYINSKLPADKRHNDNEKMVPLRNLQIINNTTITSNVINAMKSCKKILFVEPEVPSIRQISQDEFLKIPKYIIGRYPVETLNNFISSINEIIKYKYSLISLGKNGAKKKGEMDLFLQYSKEMISLGSDERSTYFFTPDDYARFFKCKLDKTKLNLIIALRHCKRLREIRTAKAIFYALI